MGYGSEEKKEQTVEISMDGFVETLEALRDDNEFRFGDEDSTNAAWDLFIEMVKGESLNLSGGPKSVLHDFQYYAEVVPAKDYEKKYPRYAKIMSWDEFLRNECLCGNDEVAVLNIG